MKLLICLSNTELVLVVSERSRVVSCSALPAPVDHDALATLLDGVPKGLKAELVLDLLDEERFIEKVPKVMPWEQALVLKRTLKRRKGADAFLYSRWLGAEKSEHGRMEKTAQVVAIADTTEIDTLLQTLKSAGIAVQHIYSLSELVANYCQPAKRKNNDDDSAEIILVKTAPSTYRQILVVNNITRLSRQIHLQDDNYTALKNEQTGFERFIMVQRLVPFGQQFHYSMVGWDNDTLQAMGEACDVDGQNSSELKAASALIKDEQQLLSEYPALALAVNRKLGQSHFQPPRLEQDIRQRQVLVTIWLLVAGLAIAAGAQGITLAVKQYHHNEILMNIAGLQSKYLGNARQYETLADLPARADDIKDSAEFVEAVAALREEPGLAVSLIGLSKVLSQYPDLDLKKISWFSAEKGTNGSQQLILRLSITPGRTPLQEVSSDLTRFMDALQAMEGVEKAKRGRIAIDADMESSLDVDLNRDDAAEYEFEVRVDLNYGNPKA